MSDEVAGLWRDQVSTNKPELFGGRRRTRGSRPTKGSKGRTKPGRPLPRQTGGSARASVLTWWMGMPWVLGWNGNFHLELILILAPKKGEVLHWCPSHKLWGPWRLISCFWGQVKSQEKLNIWRRKIYLKTKCYYRMVTLWQGLKRESDTSWRWNRESGNWKSSRGRRLEWGSGIKKRQLEYLLLSAWEPYISPAAELPMDGNKNVPNHTISTPVKRERGGCKLQSLIVSPEGFSTNGMESSQICSLLRSNSKQIMR